MANTVLTRGLLGMYGNTGIPRKMCPDCCQYSFVIEKQFTCCGRLVDVRPENFQQMSTASGCRRKPSKREREQILHVQNDCCLYCCRKFGSTLEVFGKTVFVSIRWDHWVPIAYRTDNRFKNFVAACQKCNAWKGSKVFETLEEARNYLARRWDRYLHCLERKLNPSVSIRL